MTIELQVTDSTGAFKLGGGPADQGCAVFNITSVSGTLIPYSGYYWTDEWQEGEAEADAQSAAGEVVAFDDLDTAMDYLRNF